MSDFLTKQLKSIDTKERKIISNIIDILSKAFNGEWLLNIYTDKDIYSGVYLSRYLIMYWSDPYTFKVGIKEDDYCIFEVCDSTFDTAPLCRKVQLDKLVDGDIYFFIDSIKEFLSIEDKLCKFKSNYNICDLPKGYKRNDKIKQLLG